MGIWRWERDPNLGFPPAIVIRKRKFRSRRQLEAFKQSLVQRAMRERSKMRDESAAATDRPVARRPRVGGRLATACVEGHRVDRSKQYLMDRLKASGILDVTRVARAIKYTRFASSFEPSASLREHVARN